MAAKTEILDLKLPAAILALGQTLCESRGMGRNPSGTSSSDCRPEAMEAEIERLLKQLRASPARRFFGLHQNCAEKDDPAKLKTIALLSWQMLGENSGCTHIEDVARVISDGRGQPCEQLLLQRDCLGRMVTEDLIVLARSEGERWTGRLLLPQRTILWISGGQKSMGHFDIQRMDLARLKRGRQGESQPAQKRIPTAKELYDAVLQDVGLPLAPVVKVLASRFAMHAARAEMLKAGPDDQSVSQMVLCLVASSGAGKSYLASRLSAHSKIPLVQYDSTVLTSQGFVGADLDEPYRLLINSVGGDPQEAAKGVILLDEWDKKSTRYSRHGSGGDICTLAIQQEILNKLQSATPFLVGGRRQYDSRPFLFDGRLTGYLLAGVFSGLDEIIGRKSVGKGIGFGVGVASEAGSRRHVRIQDAMKEYGYLDELVNRIGCVVRLPDPTHDAVAHALVTTILDGFNRLLAPKEIIILPTEAGIREIADFSIESKGFYRAAKAVLAAFCEECFFDPHPGLVTIGKDEARHAIDRLSSGIVQNADDSAWDARPADPVALPDDISGSESGETAE